MSHANSSQSIDGPSPHEWTAISVADRVRRGELSAIETVAVALKRIAERNGALNAFVSVDEAGAYAQAELIDRRVREGADPGPLAGVPVGVKDFGDDVRGSRTTEGSNLFKDVPPALSDSTHVARLRAAGAIIVGRTAAAEFGLDASTTTDLYGVTRNPWDLERTPGGSSGGSAAAVAAGMVPIATGTDSGGSIRAPAAHCNLVGLKPTFGSIPQSERGAWLNAIGVLCKTVADAARHLDVARGPSNLDRFSLPQTGRNLEASLADPPAAGLRAIFSKDLGYVPMDMEVLAIVEAAMQRLVKAVGLQMLDLPVDMPNVYPAYGIVAFRNLKRLIDTQYDGNVSAVTSRLQTRLTMEHLFTPEKLWEAEQTAIAAEVCAARLFEAADIVISPVTPIPPHMADGPTPTEFLGLNLTGIGVEGFPMWANYTGCPSISVPAGFTREGLPVGLLLTAPRHGDELLLRLAASLERASPWPLEAPLQRSSDAISAARELA